MTDAELGEAIMREVCNERVVLEITASLLKWMTDNTLEVATLKTKRGVYIVRVLMPRHCEPVYTHADTLPRAVAEAALRVAREVKR